MVVSPKLRYLQSEYYLYDHSTHITNIVNGAMLTDYERKIREINASYAVMCCSGYNPEEVDLDQCLYRTSDVVPEFCRELAKLQNNPLTLQDYIIGQNEQFKDMMQSFEKHKRSLQIKTKQIALGKSFPHMFRGNIKYRTDANIRVDYLNSPAIKYQLIDLKNEFKKRKQTTRFGKYFSKVDRDCEEILDYLGEVYDGYSHKFWADDI